MPTQGERERVPYVGRQEKEWTSSFLVHKSEVLRESYRHALSVLLRCERADDEGLVDEVVADEAPNVVQRARRQVVHIAEMVVENGPRPEVTAGVRAATP